MPLTSAYVESYGIVKKDECITWTQKYSNATFTNFTSVTYPNQTKVIFSPQIAASKTGSEYYYEACNWSSISGVYEVCGTTDVDGVDTDFCIDYDVTQTGDPTPDGMPTLQAMIIFIIFGIASFMLYLSMQFNEAGPKIFFFLTSFVFIMATIMTIWQVSYAYNVADGLTTSTTVLMYAFGMILLLVFFYIMIRQTVVILDMFKFKRGLSWGAGVTGYKSNNFMQ